MIVFPQYCRLIYLEPSGQQVDLLLDGVHVAISILDIHANVKLSQRFKNTHRSAVDATYTLAKNAAMAVSGFEMVRGNGTKVIGKVFEKVEAKKKYDAAVDKGQTASLGMAETDDLFTICVGNIQPGEVVTINLSFSQPLTDDEKGDQVRFTFPRSYGQRYGAPPTENIAKSMSQVGLSQEFTLDCQIQQAGPIKSISCPSSHPIELSLGKPDDICTDESIPDSHFASIKLSSQPLLSQDIVLVITANGLDKPRCFAEPHPASDRKTTAMAMSFVPKFTLPDIEGGMEYIFVVDRSGSMDDTSGSSGTSRIGLVRQALTILLKGLPSKNTRFNIVSFGSKCDSLWSKSSEYNQGSLEKATKHVSKMGADYGGTETGAALQHAFKSLGKDRKQPTSIFLLTDGDAWNVAETVTTAKAILSPKAPFVRVFSVGIGSGISTDTCDSVARAGEGFAIYIQDGEPMTGKCARLVRASRSPPVKDVRVEWVQGPLADEVEDFEIISEAESTKSASEKKPEQTVNLFDDTATDTPKDVGPPAKTVVKLGEPAGIRSAPSNAAFIFPGTRVNFFALISDRVLKEHGIPKTVKVLGTVSTTGATVELEVPLVCYQPSKGSIDSAPLIHTLAAHALITDLQDGKLEPPSGAAEKLGSDSTYRAAYIEAEIVRLGVTYGLTSRHTSYVAIDETNNAVKKGEDFVNDCLYETTSQDAAPAYSMPLFGSRVGACGGGFPHPQPIMRAAAKSSSPFGMGSFARSKSTAVQPPLRANPTGMYGAPPPPPMQSEASIALFGPSMAPGAAVSFPLPISSSSFGMPEKEGNTQGDCKRETTPLTKQAASPRSRGGFVPSFSMFSKSKKMSPSGSAVSRLFGSSSSKQAEEEDDEEDQAFSLCEATSNDGTVTAKNGEDNEARLFRLASFQHFDGHFESTKSLNDFFFNQQCDASLTKYDDFKKTKILDSDEPLLATIVAMAWMEKFVKDESLDLVEKSLDWIKENKKFSEGQIQTWIQDAAKIWS